MNYPNNLLKLIEVFKKLPGVGTKSAERFAFHLLTCSEKEISEMAKTIASVKVLFKNCVQCGCLIDEKGCSFCNNQQRNHKIICILASPRDVFSIESTREYSGLYHVLGGLLSPLDGKEAKHLHIEKLKNRILSLSVQEVIIALDSTLEGDTTALYLKRELAPLSRSISRLAFGLPMGSSLDYVDGGTLAYALAGRQQL